VEAQNYRAHQQRWRQGKKTAANKAFNKPYKKPYERAVGIEVTYYGKHRKNKENNSRNLAPARGSGAAPFLSRGCIGYSGCVCAAFR
jgi:hypothetical protein